MIREFLTLFMFCNIENTSLLVVFNMTTPIKDDAVCIRSLFEIAFKVTKFTVPTHILVTYKYLN